MGHPEFSSKEDETYAALEEKLIELIAVKGNVVKNLTETTDKLLVVTGAVIEDAEHALERILNDARERLSLKSCAEFGYKYVYLD
jgi:hypothetical protein